MTTFLLSMNWPYSATSSIFFLQSHSSLRDSDSFLDYFPSHEWLGYFRASRWDATCDTLAGLASTDETRAGSNAVVENTSEAPFGSRQPFNFQKRVDWVKLNRRYPDNVSSGPVLIVQFPEEHRLNRTLSFKNRIDPDFSRMGEWNESNLLSPGRGVRK
jgi:hypothetical protein